jgi:dTDP-4-amino-4,6-dideoxygalactose transaminase
MKWWSLLNPMRVPLLDLKAQYSTIRNEVRAGIDAVLDSQICIGGPFLAELEERIAHYSEARFALGVSSGTDAILCALMALGIGDGDEVITTPFTFFATAGCIARVGARPVFVDIDTETFNIRPDLIESAISSRTRAIIPVHLFGQVCDMDPILEIAARHNLYVIEDAAQSIGATYKKRSAGSMGTCGCFSFFPSKNLGAAGDGGMIVTNDEALHQKVLLLRNHGAHPKYYHSMIGGNFRLDAIQAAVLLAKLPHLESWSEGRRRNAEFYAARFAGTPVQVPKIAPERISIYNQYCVLVPDRNSVQSKLAEMGVSTEIYYPVPLHLQECFSYLGYRRGSLPVAEQVADAILALPIYPELSAEALEHVATSLLNSVGQNVS